MEKMSISTRNTICLEKEKIFVKLKSDGIGMSNNREITEKLTICCVIKSDSL